jgi:hypothetical protein
MSALHYQGVFEQSVSQTTEITLAGQTDSAPVAADFTITLAVTKAQLDSALTWTGAYVAADETNAREEAFPEVTFDVQSLISLAAHSVTVADFSDVTKDNLNGANSAVPTLQGRFKQITSAFSGISSWTPANVPLEAVIKVVNNALTGNTLSQTLQNPAASSAKDSHPVSLYEQAIAADKTKPAAGALPAGADFAVNDSISVYVDYTLAKTRRYIMDTADGTKDEVANVAGMTVGDGDEESATEHAIYQILFVVSA